MIAKITRVYLRQYSDNGQRTLYIDWTDNRGKTGTTECEAEEACHNEHMQALLNRANREGIALEHETW